MLVDEPAQCLHRRIGGLERHGAGAGAACRETHQLDGQQREIAAHRQAIALASEKALLVERDAQPIQSLGFVAGERQYRIGGERAQPRDAFARSIA